MRTRLPVALLLLVSIGAASSLHFAASARAAAQPVVAVLYVDNHSGDPGHDVLAKGLADMLVTDLLAQGLTVVERARLQALIDEQALQKSAFFDPKTAVRVGKGLGASHVVIGALAAVKPEMRLDLRLIDVSSGAVTVTAKAQGDGAKVFELEQTLVARFVEAFERRFAPPASPQTKIKDTAALLEYSRGLDLADRGQLEEAQKKMEQSIRLSPGFVLARQRKDELAKRIASSRERRDTVVLGERLALGMAAQTALAKPGDGPERVAWRNVQLQLLAAEVAAHMSAEPFGVAAVGHEKELRAAMLAYAAGCQAYIEDLDRALAAKPSFFDAKLRGADEARARAAGLEYRAEESPVLARLRLARFVLDGRLKVPPDRFVNVAPPLAVLEPAWEARGYKLFGETFAVAEKGTFEHLTIETLDDWAESLYLRGRTEEAVAKWQEILDRYPTSFAYDRVEARLKGVLGMVHEHTASELESWSKGLAGCLDMPLRVGLDTVLYRRMRIHGLAALDGIAAEVEKACRGNPSAKQFWNYLYTHLALTFGKHLRCAEFEAWMARGKEFGAAQGDINGWRQNWTKCPLP